MIPLEEARADVLARVPRLPSVQLPADDACNLVLAEPVVASEPVPPFDNTAMDGFAVRAADTEGAPVELDVIATLAAGADPAGVRVGPGQAARIMTGAPIPDGADAIIMVESTAPLDGGERVRIETVARPDDHVRHAGEDVHEGDVVVAAGTVLSPVHVGVLASVGVTHVTVVRRARVGVLSTGDELVDGTAPLRPGQLRDSNRHSLRALVTADGFEVIDLGLVPDDKEAVASAITNAAETCDALLTSGGVSMGDFDEVKAVLSELADDMRWMQIAIRPAKPFAFGTVGAMPVFGLPGNPVSSLVSYELLARPALRQMMGHAPDDLDRPRLQATAEQPLSRRPDGKTHFARVVVSVVDGRLVARSAGGQGSHQLAAMGAANALAVLPDGDGVAADESVEVIVTGELQIAGR
jgi:molybdenum cofactor synthesis domain-containing protein